MPTQATDLSREVLETHEMMSLPVDPFAIAGIEEIELAPGKYTDGFDARIEFIPEATRFAIYYRPPGSGRPRGRVNFSIAHELGHFYLPHHREQLLRGEMHNSTSNFRSTAEQEREADEFAANLLMPRDLFIDEVRRFRQRVCTLKELSQLADERLGTSLTSTVRRYCQCDIEPCIAVFSKDGVVQWAMPSADMKAMGMGYVPFKAPVPKDSKTREAFQVDGVGTAIDGRVLASAWFDNPTVERVWEDVLLLGRTGFAITLITPDE